MSNLVVVVVPSFSYQLVWTIVSGSDKRHQHTCDSKANRMGKVIRATECSDGNGLLPFFIRVESQPKCSVASSYDMVGERLSGPTSEEPPW